MKRPIIYILFGYILGIILGLYCNISIVFLYLIIISIYLISKKIYKPQKKFKLISFRRYFRYVKLIFNLKTIILIIIFSLISNFIVINLNKKYERLYSDFEDEINITATVVSREKEKSYKYIYRIKVESINENDKFKNTYLMLNINKKLNIKLDYGDKVEITGTFKEPETQRNYKGFNYKSYLKTVKVYGSIDTTCIKVIKKDNVNVISLMSNKLFIYSKHKIENLFSKDSGNILIGIIFGDTTGIAEDIKESFKISNISHILAVSGMHISYIIIGLTYIFRCLGKRTSKIFISIFLVVYMFITNFSPSVVRSSIMATLMLYSGIFYRKNDIWTSMSISLLILLIYNPFLIKNISVQFSYGGTIGIVLFQKNILSILNKLKIQNRNKRYKRQNKYIVKIIQKIEEILSVTMSAQIIIMPIMIINFNTLGIYFLITNLIVSLIIGPIVILGFILIISSFVSMNLVTIISIILEPFLQTFITTSKNISNLEFSTIYLKTPRIIGVVVYYILIFILNFLYKVYSTKSRNLTNTQIRVKNLISLAKYKINKTKVIVIILIICILLTSIHIYPKNLKIYFIDVGQGDSTLIVTPHNKTILIDGGGSINSDFDVGKSTLLPYLLDRRITKLDYILISHFDQDHVRSECLQ